MISLRPRTPLCELARKHGTDKSYFHEYGPVYYEVLKGRKITNVLEIGIGGVKDGQLPYAAKVLGYDYKSGASLRMWAEFFPEATINGFDIDVDNLVQEGRIRSFQCDQNNPDMLRLAADAAGGTFDLIIDDGSHNPVHQITSMHALLPRLNKGGVYVIEDMNVDPQYLVDRIPSDWRGIVYDCPSPYPVTGKLLVIDND